MINYRYTLVDLEGQVCVLYESTFNDDPIIQRLWWPTGARTCNISANFIGQALVTGLSEHGYRFADPAMPRISIVLVDRGKTKAIKVERIAAPSPPAKLVRGKPVRWSRGQWIRTLRTGDQEIGVTFPMIGGSK